MSVNVIDTIKPKNGGSFPVVEAEDVSVGAQRLPAALAEKAGTADLAALEAEIEDKASSADILQLRNEIAMKAPQSSLDATNAVVATKAAQSSLDVLSVVVNSKADKKDYTDIYAAIDTKASIASVNALENTVMQGDANLQAQINEIEISASAEAIVAPEVAAARVDADGVSHETLKARLDYETDKAAAAVDDVFDDYIEEQYPAITKASALNESCWGSDYIYRPAFVKSIAFERTGTTSEDAILVLIVDTDNVVLKKLFTKNGNISPTLEVNEYIPVPFRIVARCDKTKYGTKASTFGYFHFPFSDSNNYQAGDTLPFETSESTYPLAIKVIASSLYTSQVATAGNTDDIAKVGTETQGVNSYFNKVGVNESVWATNKVYKAGYVDTVSLGFGASNTGEKIMIMFVDSSTNKIVKKILDYSKDNVGKQTYSIHAYIATDFYIAVRAPGLAYQNDARSNNRTRTWNGAWGTYGYYNEGDTLPIVFGNDTNVKFDIDVVYDYYQAMNHIPVDTKRICTLNDAFRSWFMGAKFPVGIIGDSTTDGVGTTYTTRNVLGTDYINPKAYPYLLEQKLKLAFDNSNLRVYNFGFSGKSVQWAVQNIDEMVWDNESCNDVKMLFISHGINDYADTANRCAWFETYLRELVVNCFAHGVQPVIMTTQAGTENYTRFGFKQMSLADGINRKIADEFNLEIIDKNKFTALFNLYSSASISSIVADGCHYNDYGHEYEAGMMFAHIVPYTVWSGEEDTKLGFDNEQIRTDLEYSSFPDYKWKDVRVITPDENGFKLEAHTAISSTKTLMDFYVFIAGTSPKVVKSYCNTPNAQEIEIDGDTTSITQSEQTIATLDLGLHHIIVRSAASENVNFLGVKLINE